MTTSISLPHKRHVTWEEMVLAVDDLHMELKSHYVDTIIGVARGGMIPATLLSYLMNVPVVSYGVKSYDNTEQHDIKSYQPIPDWVTSNRQHTILIVDDISDTGNTFLHTIQMLRDRNFHGNIITAAPFVKDGTKHFPTAWTTFYGKNTWLVFPWER